MQINTSSLSNDKNIKLENEKINLEQNAFEPLFVKIISCFFSGKIEKNGEFVTVSGGANVVYEGSCYKCGKTVKKTLNLKVEEVFNTKSEEFCEVFNGKTLDISALICENMLLEIPTQILCKPNCLGLCGKCGKNLNEGKCFCEENKEGIINPANPFYSLKSLLKRKEKEDGTSKGKIKQSKNSKKSSKS